MELGGVQQEHDDLTKKNESFTDVQKVCLQPKATHWPSCRYPESALAETEILPRGKHITLSQDNSSRLRNFMLSGARWKEVGEQNLSEEYKEPLATLQHNSAPHISDILTQEREMWSQHME